MDRYQLCYYILDADGNVKTTDDQVFWANWYFNIENRRVKLTDLGDKGKVYTTFTSVMALPLLGLLPEWETMYEPVAGEKRFWKWDSLEEARLGHEDVVELIEVGCGVFLN
jgi:hypothetical protein